LNVLLDVPEGFFTVTFPMLGLLLSLSKSFVRARMEERAWEQRLEEAREVLLLENPQMTELDLRKMDAAQEYSAYGKPRLDEEKQKRRQFIETPSSRPATVWESEESGEPRRRSRRRPSVQVIDREDDENGSPYKMTREEVAQYETMYGIQYDPYYDDPYSEDDLPQDMKYTVDKIYGDRVYSNGEIFYRDGATGMYYRQGAKPRSLKLW
jgi:hypothetical protein